jgi:putative ABC transport system substrate-binding protein
MTHFGHPLAGVSAAAASIQNDSGLSKDSFGTLWQAERAADRLLRGSTLLGMRRREFITLIGGAAVWPLAARAQRGDRVRSIAVLMNNAEDDPEGRARAAAFRQGLQELGWTDGHNLRIEWRWSGGDVGRIRAHAAEIAELAPELVVANGTANLSAVRQAIRSIPIVFVVVNDPVGQGFISSLAHPGGNITGFTFVEYSMLGKWLEMLKLVAPAVTRVALMFNPDTVPYDRFLSSFEAETRKYPVTVTSAHVRSEAEVEAVIAGLAAAPGGGLIVPPDAYTLVRRGLIVQAVARHRIPAIYSYRQFVKEGGLMSYAPDTADVFRRSAWYVDRILNGAKPAELPAQAPIKFEFVINLKTATTLGLTVPPTVHALTDEVIE